ncbi:MAG: preprotein translocase subunit SecE [Coriobacteriia bacterium]|nr:preprotein translocase subunit SecE [Coriobacteriia bacterium]
MAKTIDAELKTKPGKPAKAKSPKADKPNLFARLAQYLRDVRSEMKRVVWPDRPEVINSSLVVVVTLLFFVAFTFILDSIVVQVLDVISNIGG